MAKILLIIAVFNTGVFLLSATPLYIAKGLRRWWTLYKDLSEIDGMWMVWLTCGFLLLFVATPAVSYILYNL